MSKGSGFVHRLLLLQCFQRMRDLAAKLLVVFRNLQEHFLERRLRGRIAIKAQTERSVGGIVLQAIEQDL